MCQITTRSPNYPLGAACSPRSTSRTSLRRLSNHIRQAPETAAKSDVFTSRASTRLCHHPGLVSCSIWVLLSLPPCLINLTTPCAINRHKPLSSQCYKPHIYIKLHLRDARLQLTLSAHFLLFPHILWFNVVINVDFLHEMIIKGYLDSEIEDSCAWRLVTKLLRSSTFVSHLACVMSYGAIVRLTSL